MGLNQFIFVTISIGFWALASNQFLLGGALASIVIAGYFTKNKLPITQKTSARAMDLTFLAIALSVLWFYFTRASLTQPLPFKILSICPALFFPKIAFLLFTTKIESTNSTSIKDGVHLVLTFITKEHPHAHQKLDAPKNFNYPIVYALMCLFVTIMALPQNLAIAFAFAGLFSIAIFTAYVDSNSKNTLKSSLILCFFTVISALTLGFSINYFVTQYADRLGPIFNNKVGEGLTSTFAGKTAIGEGGSLEAGNKLLYRIKWGQEKGYIRSATFSYLHTFGPKNTWVTDRKNPESQPYPDKTIISNKDDVFEINPQTSNVSSQIALIATNLPKERNALALPQSTIEISGLPLDKLEINKFFAISTSGTPGFVQFSLRYSPDQINSATPDGLDLSIPEHLIPNIDALLLEANLTKIQTHDKTPKEIALIIQKFFVEKWMYTLDLNTKQGQPRTLLDFFFTDRRGHCEFFATTGALMLRRLGIPARYETGFAVTEYNPQEKLFWVRARDAHAWNIFWDGSSWNNADFTVPGINYFFEQSQYADLLEQFQYMLDTFDMNAVVGKINKNYLFAIIFVLASILAFKILKAQNIFQKKNNDSSLEPLYAQLHSLVQEMCAQKCPTTVSAPQFWQQCAINLPAHISTELNQIAQFRFLKLFAPEHLQTKLNNEQSILQNLILCLKKEIKQSQKQ